MAWALFTVGLVFALLTIHSHRPLRWPGPTVLGAWFATWPTIELALHVLVVQVAAAAVLAALGGLEHWPGVVGIGLCAVSWIGLARHYANARETYDRMEQALESALGTEYRTELAGWRHDDRQPARWWRLTRVFPIRLRGVHRHANIEYHNTNSRKHRLDVYHHESRPTGRPILLYVHGGGWIIGNKGQQGLLTVNQLAARGWVCVSINYRLSPKATFPDHLLDVKRAIKWVRENAAEYGGDPDFIMLAGGSAGAHLAALSALTPNDPEYQKEFANVETSVSGCVGYYGVYDFTDCHSHWPHKTFKVLLERVIMKRRFADAKEEYEKASPLHRVGTHAPPFFLIHGNRDNLAPVGEARRFSEALRKVSKQPVVYAELPGAQHAFELFPSVRSLHTIDAVERFCEYVYAQHCRQRAVARND